MAVPVAGIFAPEGHVAVHIAGIFAPEGHLAVPIHCGKKDRKFPSQVTDAADHNKPVTEHSGIKFPSSLSDCSAIYIGIFSAIYFGIKMC